MSDADKAKEEYNQKLDEHSAAIRYDPLRDAVRRVLDSWGREDPQERNDLSEEFWDAMGWLQIIFTGAER
jgi:hypothetical protein